MRAKSLNVLLRRNPGTIVLFIFGRGRRKSTMKYRTFRSARARFVGGGAVPLAALSTALLMPVIAHGQAPAKSSAPVASPWKVITSPEAGISVLMAPGASFKSAPRSDPKTGDKTVLAVSQVKSDGTDPYFYIVEAFRINTAALDDLRTTAPEYSKDPIAVLVEKSLKPFLSTVSQVPKGEKPPTISRKAITWSGMKGEEFTVSQDSGPHKGSYGRLRVVTTANGFFMLFGA